MIVFDLTVVLGSNPFNDRASSSGVCWRDERRQPAIGDATDSLEFRRSKSAEPDVHSLRGRQDTDVFVVEVGAFVAEELAGPTLLHHVERLVEDLGPLGSLDAEGLLLDRVDSTETECGQQAPTGHSAKSRQRFGQHHRVAAGEHHHGHAELEVRRSTGTVGNSDQRVGCLAADLFRQPERIEGVRLECVDDDAVRLIMQVRASSEAVADANFQLFAHAGRAIGSTMSASATGMLTKGEWSVSRSNCAVHLAANTAWCSGWIARSCRHRT